MDDRRKYKRLRFGVDVVVTYYRKKAGGTEIINKLRTKDISAGGIRALVPSKLNPGTVVSVELTMPYTGEEISCFALVAWVEPAGEGKFETGLAFSDLSREETAMIDRFVETELEKGIE